MTIIRKKKEKKRKLQRPTSKLHIKRTSPYKKMSKVLDSEIIVCKFER